MTYHQLIKYIPILFFLMLVACANSNIETNHTSLEIKQVIDNSELTLPKGYYFGRTKYKNYESVGLEENFKIKALPDIYFTKEDIEEITIQHNRNSSSKEDIEILIIFNEIGENKIHNYTKENIGKKISIEVDNNIISIATIAGSLNKKIKLFMSAKSIEAIYNTFLKVTKNVTLIKP